MATYSVAFLLRLGRRTFLSAAIIVALMASSKVLSIFNGSSLGKIFTCFFFFLGITDN
jgi:hypothetical protein